MRILVACEESQGFTPNAQMRDAQRYFFRSERAAKNRSEHDE